MTKAQTTGLDSFTVMLLPSAQLLSRKGDFLIALLLNGILLLPSLWHAQVLRRDAQDAMKFNCLEINQQQLCTVINTFIASLGMFVCFNDC